MITGSRASHIIGLIVQAGVATQLGELPLYRSFDPVIAEEGDTINFPNPRGDRTGGVIVRLDHQMDFELTVDVGCYWTSLHDKLQPLCMIILDFIQQSARGKIRPILVTRRLPLPLSETVKSASYAEGDSIGYRIVCFQIGNTVKIVISLLFGVGNLWQKEN